MKKLLLSLMVFATLASCGKDNKVSSAASTSSSSAITISDSTAQSIGSMIDSSDTYFGQAQVTAYETWNQAAAAHPNYYYTYTKSNASSNCELKSGWLGIKYYVCKSGSSSASSVSRRVLVSQVDITAKRNELKSILNSTTAGTINQSQTYVNGRAFNVYQVRTTSGVIYTIDTRFPIQANPVITQQADGTVEYFLGMYLPN